MCVDGRVSGVVLGYSLMESCVLVVCSLELNLVFLLMVCGLGKSGLSDSGCPATGRVAVGWEAEPGWVWAGTELGRVLWMVFYRL